MSRTPPGSSTSRGRTTHDELSNNAAPQLASTTANQASRRGEHTESNMVELQDEGCLTTCVIFLQKSLFLLDVTRQQYCCRGWQKKSQIFRIGEWASTAMSGGDDSLLAFKFPGEICSDHHKLCRPVRRCSLHGATTHRRWFKSCNTHRYRLGKINVEAPLTACDSATAMRTPSPSAQGYNVAKATPRRALLYVRHVHHYSSQRQSARALFRCRIDRLISS